MNKHLANYLLGRLAKKRCMGEIPRSGEEALHVNCFVTYLKDEEDWALLLKEVTDRAYVGTFWDGGSFSAPASIPFSLNKNPSVEINHYYKQYNFKFNSIAGYLVKGLSGYYKAKAMLDKTQQFWFNRKTLVLSERVDVLKVLLSETIENEKFEVNEVTLPNHIHGWRYILHPDQKRQQRYAQLLLESLVHSKEMEKGRYGGYILTGKALETISKYESAERKHEESINQSKAMKWLTLALILVGLVQAASTYFASK